MGDLQKGFNVVKCFSESACEALKVMLGSCSKFVITTLSDVC